MANGSTVEHRQLESSDDQHDEMMWMRISTTTNTDNFEFSISSYLPPVFCRTIRPQNLLCSVFLRLHRQQNTPSICLPPVHSGNRTRSPSGFQSRTECLSVPTNRALMRFVSMSHPASSWIHDDHFHPVAYVCLPPVHSGNRTLSPFGFQPKTVCLFGPDKHGTQCYVSMSYPCFVMSRRNSTGFLRLMSTKQFHLYIKIIIYRCNIGLAAHHSITSSDLLQECQQENNSAT